jgi:hypothetical protein
MDNRADMQTLLRANQTEWVTDMPSGMTETFSRTLSANLADKDQRMAFVIRAANRFNALLHGPQRTQVERSIQTIGSGGGIS